jgi:cytochrome o ubiquinol oxidase subunit III
MSAIAPNLPATFDPHRLGHRDGGPEAADYGPAPKRVIVGYGFWIFLLSDFVMFSGFFAAYAVLGHSTADGPGPRELFDLRNVGIETACLLLSSFTCGMASIAVDGRRVALAQFCLLLTAALGLAFLTLEIREFASLVARGDGPQRSAFLSSFFTLVGCHGLHVTAGLLWLGTMMAQLFAGGFAPNLLRRFKCWSLFWHALDIIWVAVFTVVYLIPGKP